MKKSQPNSLEQEFLRLHAARTSFAGFCEYIAPHEPPDSKHLKLFCELADDIVSGDKRRVMIVVPPGSAKSTYLSQRFPAYLVGRTKGKGVICASHTVRLAEKFGRKVRNLVATPDYQRLFSVQLTEDSKAKGQWDTTQGGYYFACGVGGDVTGNRADYIIADDLIKNREMAESELLLDKAWDFWTDDLDSRLKPNGCKILINTRWSENDISGRILGPDWDGESGWVQGTDGHKWFVVCLPAIAEHGDFIGRKPDEGLWMEYWGQEREDYWHHKREFTPSRTWNSLYQGNPTPDDGEFFKREWFRRYVDVPRHLGVYMSGDFATTDDGGDFTELAVWGIDQQGNIRALDWWSGQKNTLEWIKRWFALVRRYKPRVFVGEMGPIRRSVEPLMRATMRQHSQYTALEWLPSSQDKTAYARGFQGMAENGIVYFPKTSWADDVISQLLKFPAGRYDDKVDACSLMGRYLDKLWGKTPPRDEKNEFKLVQPTMLDFEPDDDFKRMRK